MSETKKVIRQDQAVVLGISCLVVGFTLGMIVYHFTMSAPAQAPATSFQAPPPSIQPPGAAFQSNTEELREAKKFAEQNPKNLSAWVTLGNLYFDSQQPNESIAAYTKALAIDPKDPNVITDRGIMYRAIGDFDSAIADFRKAADLDPTHYQSLYHLGLVLLHDKRDIKGAKAAWDKMMTRNPPPEVTADMATKLPALQKAIDNPNLDSGMGAPNAPPMK
jgi:cytochrome c-type biogenesis protein CcmH/NrfG